VDTGEFFIEAYVDRQPSGCGDYGDGWGWTDSIPAGGTQTIVIPIESDLTDGLSQGSHQIRVFADTECVEGESN
jgi:hypothetical protein